MSHTQTKQAAHEAAYRKAVDASRGAGTFAEERRTFGRTYHAEMMEYEHPAIEAQAREAALREAANRALLSVSAIRSVCDMHGAVSCSLQNQGKDCLCQEREEQAEYINQKILALIQKEPTNAG
jgi:hypothetical protein